MRSCSTGSRLEPPERMSATASSNQPSYRSAASSHAARVAACMWATSAASSGVAGRTLGVGEGSSIGLRVYAAAESRKPPSRGRRPTSPFRGRAQFRPRVVRRVAGSWPGPPSSTGATVARQVARAGDGRHVRSSARCVFARRRLAGNLPAPSRAAPWGRSHRHVRDLRGPPRGEEVDALRLSPRWQARPAAVRLAEREPEDAGVPATLGVASLDGQRERSRGPAALRRDRRGPGGARPMRHRDGPGGDARLADHEDRRRGERLGRSGGDGESAGLGRRPAWTWTGGRRRRGPSRNPSRAAGRSSPRRRSGSRRAAHTPRRRPSRSTTRRRRPCGSCGPRTPCGRRHRPRPRRGRHLRAGQEAEAHRRAAGEPVAVLGEEQRR